MNWNLFRSPGLRRAVQALFDTTTGHDHDGDNSKILSASAVVGEDSVTTSKIQDDAVTEPKIADDAVTESKIKTNAVTTTKIADTNVTTGKLDSGAVTAAKLGAKAVETAKIDDKAVETGQIGDNAVDTLQLATDAVEEGNITDLNVTSGKLANSAVTFGKIAADAVRVNEIQDSAVATAKIANGAVDKDKLANDVAGDGLSGGTGTALSVNVDDSTIETSGSNLQVVANGITNTQIAAETVRLAEMADLTRGNVIVGNATAKPSALDASGDANILVGDTNDLNSVGMSGDVHIDNSGATTIQDEAVSTGKMADLTRGSILRGATDNKVGALAAVTAGYIVYGDGTDVTAGAMGGDGTLNGSGELTIADDAVTLAKMDDLVRGNIIIGDATNDPSALDVSTAGHILIGGGDDPAMVDVSADGQILIGNGTSIAMQGVGGDLTGDNSGNFTINSGAVTEDKIDNEFMGVGYADLTGANNGNQFGIWQNDTGKNVLVHRVLVDVTVAGGTPGGLIDVGTASSDITSDNLIDGADANATAVYDNIDDQGTNGESKQKLPSGSYVTAYAIGDNAASLEGKMYVYYTAIPA